MSSKTFLKQYKPVGKFVTVRPPRTPVVVIAAGAAALAATGVVVVLVVVVMAAFVGRGGGDGLDDLSNPPLSCSLFCRSKWLFS